MISRLFRALLVMMAAAGACPAVLAAPGELPRGVNRPGYADEAECRQCHRKETELWRASKHRRAMEPATAQTVDGDFRVGAKGLPPHIKLNSQGKGFAVETLGKLGTLESFPVAFTLGVYPLQQYLLPLPGGRLQAFTQAWDQIGKRWFDLQADFAAKPGDSLHWTGLYQNWNLMCAECHTTDLQKGYDQKTDRYKTTWANDTVACQACHGPGQKHAKAARQGRAWPPYGASSFATGEVDRCASCHSRRTRLQEKTDPRGHFLDNFVPDNLRGDLYHPDGQQAAEVFEYGSFRQSRMYQAGVTCSACHDPHGGKPVAEGNKLCLRCHEPRLDDRGHHFHEPGQPGSQCVNCHMPASPYMVVHQRRDHAIRIPRPDLSLRLGSPNACNGCHTDKGAEWAQAAIEQRHGKRSYPVHYGEVLAAARARRPGSDQALLALAADLKQPGIVRSSAVEALGQIAPSQIPVAALRDADPVVRVSAAAALGHLAPQEARPLLLPLLSDPIRAVRIAAGRGLVGVDEASLISRDQTLLRSSWAEFIAAQTAMADMPAAQLNLAGFYAERGQVRLAELHFRRALRFDPSFELALFQFSQWLRSQGRLKEASQVQSSRRQ